jgi:hypothetical protein
MDLHVTILLPSVFRLISINGHDKNKRLEEINFHLWKCNSPVLSRGPWWYCWGLSYDTRRGEWCDGRRRRYDSWWGNQMGGKRMSFRPTAWQDTGVAPVRLAYYAISYYGDLETKYIVGHNGRFNMILHRRSRTASRNRLVICDPARGVVTSGQVEVTARRWILVSVIVTLFIQYFHCLAPFKIIYRVAQKTWHLKKNKFQWSSWKLCRIYPNQTGVNKSMYPLDLLQR